MDVAGKSNGGDKKEDMERREKTGASSWEWEEKRGAEREMKEEERKARVS